MQPYNDSYLMWQGIVLVINIPVIEDSNIMACKETYASFPLPDLLWVTYLFGGVSTVLLD